MGVVCVMVLLLFLICCLLTIATFIAKPLLGRLIAFFYYFNFSSKLQVSVLTIQNQIYFLVQTLPLLLDKICVTCSACMKLLIIVCILAFPVLWAVIRMPYLVF
ncbi:hypothetical protein CsatB_010640 [Cannabis sativa]